MADARTARRTAEKLARDALGGTLLGAAGELGVALARRAEAAGTIAAATENAREIVRAAEADTGYAAAWRAATTAGWAPAQLRGMGYPRPVTPRRRAAAPAPAEPLPGAEHSPAAAGG